MSQHTALYISIHGVNHQQALIFAKIKIEFYLFSEISVNWLFIKIISIRQSFKLKYQNYEVNKNRSPVNSSWSKRTGCFKLGQFLPVQFI
jgi:hypothetical protein